MMGSESVLLGIYCFLSVSGVLVCATVNDD